jgi:hypothetical protein
VTISMFLATIAAGVFAGAATYVTVAEHPARLECGQALAVREFGPSYRRAAVMQVSLALVGLLASVVAWYQGAGVAWLAWGLLFGMLIPFTLVVIKPTNQGLLDPGLDSSSPEAGQLLSRWGRLHAARTAVGVAVFVAFVAMCLRS